MRKELRKVNQFFLGIGIVLLVSGEQRDGLPGRASSLTVLTVQSSHIPCRIPSSLTSKKCRKQGFEIYALFNQSLGLCLKSPTLALSSNSLLEGHQPYRFRGPHHSSMTSS